MSSQLKEYTEQEGERSPKRARQSRDQTVRILMESDELAKEGLSERMAASLIEVSRGTLRHYKKRRTELDLPKEVADFFETSIGLTCLRQIIFAASFVITFRNPGGIRAVSEFLDLSGLSSIVASSFGSVQKMNKNMQDEILKIGKEQQTELSEVMPSKKITVCEDETFHPETCLVAIEPVSNFILLEEYASDRKSATWNSKLTAAIGNLPIEIIQSTSDEGRSILRHAQDMKAHHSPDLFHVQHELIKATALSLSKQVRDAAEKYEKIIKEIARLNALYESYSSKHGRPKHKLHVTTLIEESQKAESIASEVLEQAVERQRVCSEAISGISTDYHCYRLSDGIAQSSQDILELLNNHFGIIAEVAVSAELSASSILKIDKAKRVLSDMVATIDFVHTEIAIRLSLLNISAADRDQVSKNLIPGMYLERVASRAKYADERRLIIEISNELIDAFNCNCGNLQNLDPNLKKQIETVSNTCADLFQRSSSCVEGRNGFLTLFHHGFHRLTDAKLAALTVVHNFHIRRPDGTTPARRFFETEHPSLFGALLQRLPSLPRPAQPRSLRPYRTSLSLAA